jgi:hypothetical protein
MRASGTGFNLDKDSQNYGLHVNTIKDVNKERQANLYTENGELKMQKSFARTLAIDEIKPVIDTGIPPQ